MAIIGSIVGLVVVIIGLSVNVPGRYISTYSGSYHAYVGGDAYNYQIEASLRGGEIAGATAAKATYISCGLILLFGSLIAFGFAAGTTSANGAGYGFVSQNGFSPANNSSYGYVPKNSVNPYACETYVDEAATDDALQGSQE